MKQNYFIYIIYQNSYYQMINKTFRNIQFYQVLGLFKNKYSIMNKFIDLKYGHKAPDLNVQSLYNDISQRLGKDYLSEAGNEQTNQYVGAIYGPEKRPMISLPMKFRSESKPYWVHFLIDTGSPKTYVSIQAIQWLAVKQQLSLTYLKDQIHLMIVNRMIDVGVGHFDGINILGTDYLNYYKVQLRMGYGQDKTVHFKIGKEQ